MATPPQPQKYIPPGKRKDFQGQGAQMPANFQTPAELVGNQLKALGFVPGAAGQYYFPNQHPHLHIGGLTKTTFMAYSEGEMDVKGVTMYEGGQMRQGYMASINKLKEHWPDKDFDHIVAAAVNILKVHDGVQ